MKGLIYATLFMSEIVAQRSCVVSCVLVNTGEWDVSTIAVFIPFWKEAYTSSRR